MRFKTLILFLLFSLVLLTSLGEGYCLDVAGIDIPVMEGAVLAAGIPTKSVHTNIATYQTNRPLDEVIGFYESFFKENNFIFLGGKENGSFSASVKKDEAMFSLRIYSHNDKTVIQFIW